MTDQPMNVQSKTVSDDDLVLLYYGEHDDPGMAARVAASAELSARFDALTSDMALAESFQPPSRGDDYGADVWQRLSPRLQDADEPGSSSLSGWFSSFWKPRFNGAGLTALALVAVVAFLLGRNGGPGGSEPAPSAPPGSLAQTGMIDPNRLLAGTVSGHLEQVNVLLTRFVNTTNSSAIDAEWATDMLVANRLYRKLATAQGDKQLAAFLAELEPTLIELAYQAYQASPATRERMQTGIQERLLFRVRVINQQLQNSGIST